MDTLRARLNWGRWITDCPACPSADIVKPIWREPRRLTFGCLDCGAGYDPALYAEYVAARDAWPRTFATITRAQILAIQLRQGGAYPVEYPADLEAIEAEMNDGRAAANQNWEWD